ncbi:metal-sensitive transcriptional regulator [Sutcliffiella horikoshii]|jgi:DNA-binding FrmR family transcriptional regulator|uniref:Cytoplasmic protein n=1 Tax=Sutcliffiella horikoshii TaxID=79883 RepID=A0A1Y0CRP7_9BACI|nr:MULTISPECIES: metal-sensitive transcriptional regulator [Bacillaceae]MEA3320399.1 metal-sensitive transcriptional regulator [Bacillota bacterium]ART77938.1 cytoplasmic protein [Sutcliffiella horikoshii]KPB04829.1 cytoplasmic protein [Bacillus sp. CHD6a]MCG1021688.1 metal-sensitive transcriptional regulator [Sutcliffiella horikoshii]NLP49598.1 metal-sensitive transcriptional regulator [Bacillus sp. RO1]
MEYTNQMKNRLKRAEGQIRGVLHMMEQGEDCRDVVSQLNAATTAIERAIGVIVSTNLEQCVRENVLKGEETSEMVQQAVDLLIKSR